MVIRELNYERDFSHTHCWNQSGSSACGIPLEKHTQCCLCDTPYSQTPDEIKELPRYICHFNHPEHINLLRDGTVQDCPCYGAGYYEGTIKKASDQVHADFRESNLALLEKVEGELRRWESAKEIIIEGRRYIGFLDGEKLPYGYPYPDTIEKYALSQVKEIIKKLKTNI
jgi:hypothetical protein